MSDDDHLEQLLDRWQQARSAGTPPTPEELCRDRPALAAELRLRILVLCWEEGWERGTPPTAESLCRDCPDLLPELRRRVQALQRVAGLVGTPTVGRAEETRPLAAEGPAHVPTVAGFEFHDQLGSGGQGWVYLALQVQLGRIVALKIPRDPLPGPEQVARFRAEAQLLARLNHPHIVQVYQSEMTADGRPCLVME